MATINYLNQNSNYKPTPIKKESPICPSYVLLIFFFFLLLIFSSYQKFPP